MREFALRPVPYEAGSGGGNATGGYFWVLRTRNGELLKIRNLLKLRAVSGRDWEGRVESELVQLRFGIGFEHEMPAPKPAKLNGYIPDRPQACGPRWAGLLGD